jgi:multiple sugar transport system ATP-binding protein
VRDPAAFLFDEPLSNLDAKLRQKMRSELKRLHREMQATMVYVTHDQVEAMTLGDRVAVMNGGKVLQIDSPLAIYHRPANLFVARFIGSVPINLQTGVLQSQGSNLRFQSGLFKLEVEAKFGPKPGVDVRSVVLGFRAEDVRLNDVSSPIRGTVVGIDRLGDMSHLHVSLTGNRTESQNIELETDHLPTDNLDIAPKNSGMVVARSAADIPVEIGQTVGLSINPERILWFDAGTGKNISKDQT